MRKWIAGIVSAETAQLRQKLTKVERELEMRDAKIEAIEKQLLEAAAWSSKVAARLTAIDEKLVELEYYKSELDARDEDNARLAARLYQDNPGIVA